MNKLMCLLALILYGIGANAQCFSTVNTVSTDWRNHISNGGNGSSDNDFNWTIPDDVYPVYLANNLNLPSRYVELPYFCTRPPGSGSCNNDNTFRYENLGNTAAEQDINPEDGWELVLLDFGTPNSSPAVSDGVGTNNPSFIIYNRHTGLMKIYVGLVGTHSGNGVNITVGFTSSGRKTALFAHAVPIAKTVDNFDAGHHWLTPNDYAVQNNATDIFWTVAEIQMAYDPCSCVDYTSNSLNSSIQIDVELITIADIELQLDGTAIQNLATGGLVDTKTTDNLSVKEILSGGYKKVSSAYEKWDKGAKKVKGFLDKMHPEHKKKMLEEFREKELPLYASTTPIPTLQTEFENFVLTQAGYQSILGVGSSSDNDVDLLANVLSIVPYVGSALAAFEYFSGLNKAPVSKKPGPPIVFDLSLMGKGTLTTSIPKHDIGFLTPGVPVKTAAGSHLTPIYNNTLGVISIPKKIGLKEDVVMGNVVQNEHSQLEGSPQISEIRLTTLDGGITQHAFDVSSQIGIRQYSLSEQPEYALNPASGLEVVSIDACLIVEYDKDDLLTFQPDGLGIIDDSKPIPFGDNILTNTAPTLADRIEDLKKSGLELEYISPDYPTGDNSVIRFRTRYVPFQCIDDVNFVLFGTDDVKPTVYMKMFVLMKEPNKGLGVTQILTYDFSTDEISTTVSSETFDMTLGAVSVLTTHLSQGIVEWVGINVEQFSFDIDNLPLANFYAQADGDLTLTVGNMGGNLFSGTIHSDGDVVFATTPPPIFDNLTVIADGTVTIPPGTTYQNTVRIIAGEKINLDPNMDITPNTEFIMSTPVYRYAIGCENPDDIANYQMNEDDLLTLCNGSTYKANTGTAPMQEEEQNIEVVNYFSVAPNPTKDNFTVSLDESLEKEWHIVVMDLNGKEVMRQENGADDLRSTVNAEALKSGVYFIQVQSEGYKKTKKIVINR